MVYPLAAMVIELGKLDPTSPFAVPPATVRIIAGIDPVPHQMGMANCPCPGCSPKEK